MRRGTLPAGVSLYAELSNSRIQRRTRNSEPGGRAIRPSNFSVAFRQSLFDDFLFVTLEGVGESTRLRTAHGLAREPRPLDGERVVIGEDHRSLNNILQLTNIAWPVIRPT